MSRIDKQTAVAQAGARLTKKDLDDQIGRVAAELFGADTEDGDCAPVPISFAEYAERMKPFLVYN